jgi:CcdB protein
MPPNNPRRYDVVRHRVRGMKAPYLIILQHHDVPSVTRIIAPLTLPQRGDHDGVAPLVDVGGTNYRARLLDLAAFPCSVLLETVTTASHSADSIVRALDVIFGGYPVGRPH